MRTKKYNSKNSMMETLEQRSLFSNLTYDDQTITLTGTGTARNDDDHIPGVGQVDDVTANLGRRLSGQTNLTARLDEGADFFTGSITGNTDDGKTRMKVYGSYGADVLTGGVGADYLDGGDGPDIIHGGA